MRSVIGLMMAFAVICLVTGCGMGQNRYGDYVSYPEVSSLSVDMEGSTITTITEPEDPYYIDLEVSYRGNADQIYQMAENEVANSGSGGKRRVVWSVTRSGYGLRYGQPYTAVVSCGAKYRHYYDDDEHPEGSYYMELRETYKTFQIQDGQILSSQSLSRSRIMTEAEMESYTKKRSTGE